MATKPTKSELNANSVKVLNAIRTEATENYKKLVPEAKEGDIKTIYAIGDIFMNYEPLKNEFINSLVNRIARVLITSKLYSNPWETFKKGMLEFGEVIEEVFVNIATPFNYNPELAETQVFKRVIPDVRTAFHSLNYKKFYKTTIQNKDLQQAFLSFDGVTNLIAKITESLYTGANYDEFLTIKYMLAKLILNGKLKTHTIPTVSSENMKNIVAEIKAVSNDFTFLSNDYNLANVYNNSEKSEQYIIINSNFDSYMDVEVLASAFNMDKADFIGHRILVDGFGKLDIARLNQLFDGVPNYTEIGESDLEALNSIPCVIVDSNFFMILDNMIQFTENFNGEGLYWNYFLHVWKTFSVSPFANNTIFISGTPEITSITVSPNTAEVTKNSTILLSATVQTNNFASQSVEWISNTENVTVNESGLVSVGEVNAGTQITIMCRSKFDSTKTAEATLTVV